MLISLNACASNRLEIPDCEVPAAEVDIQEPVRLPQIADPVIKVDSATYSKEDFAALTRYIVAAGGLYDVSAANYGALVAQSEAYNELRDCSEFQRKFSEVREEQLEQERRDHFIDVWFRNGIIALGLIGAAL